MNDTTRTLIQLCTVWCLPSTWESRKFCCDLDNSGCARESSQLLGGSTMWCSVTTCCYAYLLVDNFMTAHVTPTIIINNNIFYFVPFLFRYAFSCFSYSSIMPLFVFVLFAEVSHPRKPTWIYLRLRAAANCTAWRCTQPKITKVFHWTWRSPTWALPSSRASRESTRFHGPRSGSCRSSGKSF